MAEKVNSVKLNPTVKGKWLEALRSGDYKQGHSCLRSFDDRFCCLGVLADLYTKEHNIKWSDKLKESTALLPIRYDLLGRADTPPKEVNEWAFGTIKVDIFNTIGRLVRMNDQEGASFEQIANYIEENL